MAAKKKKLQELYHKEVKGTQDLYCNVGYFMWMKLWDEIHNLSHKIQTAAPEEHQQIYSYIIDFMNKYIENCDHPPKESNHMIFNRNSIKRLFDESPTDFVTDMKICLQKEEEILREHDMEYVATNLHQDGELAASQAPGIDDEGTEMDNAPTKDDNENYILAFIAVLKAIEQLGQECARLKNEMHGMDIWLRHSNVTPEQWCHFGLIQNKSYESFEDKKKELLVALDESLSSLKSIKDQYLQDQVRMEVQLKPKKDTRWCLQFVFDSYSNLLAKYKMEYFQSSEKFDEILASFMKLSVMVTENPKCFVSIQNENRQEKDAKKKTRSAKRKTKNSDAGIPTCEEEQDNKYCTNAVRVKLLVLGFQLYHPQLIIDSVELMREDNERCGLVSFSNPVTNGSKEIVLDQIKIHGYTRTKSCYVYFQFVRFLFHFKLSCLGSVLDIQMKSLPFLLWTGNNQKLEFVGTRLWHFGSNNNMYSGYKLKDTLSVDSLLTILGDRLCSEGKRCLSETDLQFLKGLLPDDGKENGSKQISIHSFIKAKIKNGSFSFYIWYSALANTLDNYLRDEWENGFIYGLITHEDAVRILHQSRIPHGTALIRPARSFVLHSDSPDTVQIKIIVHIKVDKDGKDWVASAVVDMEMVKKNKGFYRTLKNIAVKDVTVDKKEIRYIYTMHGVCSLDKCKRFDQEREAGKGYVDTISEEEIHLSLTISDSQRTENDVGKLCEELDGCCKKRCKKQRDSSKPQSMESRMETMMPRSSTEVSPMMPRSSTEVSPMPCSSTEVSPMPCSSTEVSPMPCSSTEVSPMMPRSSTEGVDNHKDTREGDCDAACYGNDQESVATYALLASASGPENSVNGFVVESQSPLFQTENNKNISTDFNSNQQQSSYDMITPAGEETFYSNGNPLTTKSDVMFCQLRDNVQQESMSGSHFSFPSFE